METPANPPKEDINKRIDQYVRLRDMKAEIKERHVEELKPINEALDLLGEVLLREMAAQNVTSLKTASGTASQKRKDSASMADADAFWTHVVTQGDFDLLDKKPNVTAVRDFIEKNGVPPPGINWSSVLIPSVLRAPTKSK